MQALRLALPAAVLLSAAPVAFAAQPIDPIRFFEGRTEVEGTVKVMFRKAYRTHSIGHGVIGRDGSLTLVQEVKDEGKPLRERRWNVRSVGSGRFSATTAKPSCRSTSIREYGELMLAPSDQLRRVQIAMRPSPPVTQMHSPVMYFDMSLARNSTVPTMSSTWPNRRSGIVRTCSGVPS